MVFLDDFSDVQVSCQNYTMIGMAMDSRSRTSCAITLVLTTVAAFICLTGEQLKWQVEHLPTSVSKQSLAASAANSVKLAKQLRQKTPSSAPLLKTAELQEKIAEAIERAQAYAPVQEFASTWGNAQYLIAPFALLSSLVTLLRHKENRTVRLISAVTGAISVTCVVLMLLHDYHSLG